MKLGRNVPQSSKRSSEGYLLPSMPGSGAKHGPVAAGVREPRRLRISRRRHAQKSFSMLPVARAAATLPSRLPTPAARHATRASAIRPTRPPWPKSSPSCETPAAGLTRRDCARSSWCCGARACASTRRSRSARRTSIRAAASLLVRRGKGGRRREVGMDDWAWEQLQPWLIARVELPVGPLLCIATGPTRGRAGQPGAARTELRHAAARAGARRRFAPHQLRHAHAVEMAREGVPLIVIQRQLGHTEPWHHLDLPAGHRLHRNHRHRPCLPPAHGPRRRDALASDGELCRSRPSRQ